MSRRESESDSLHADTTKNALHVEQIDINRSLSSLAIPTSSLDNILRKCGDFNRFQFIHYFFMNIITISAGINSFYYVFGAAEPDHRCRLSENIWPDDTQYKPMNQTHEIFLNHYIPKSKNGKKWEKCVRYITAGMNDTLVGCPNGWVYDRSVFGYTFTEEANSVCQNESPKSWLATALQSGGLSLLIIGSLGDKYGRKKMIVMITSLQFFTCLTTQIIIQWITMTVKTKFIVLILNQFASGLVLSSYSLVLVLMLEITSAAHTSLAGNLAFALFSMGEVLVTLFAYVTRDWQKLKWANTAFIGLIIPYLYFMPESPLYIYSKGQYVQLEANLRRIATQNGRKEMDWYPYYQEFIRSQSIQLAHKDEITFLQKFYQLLTHRKTIYKLVVTALIGFTTLMLYVKISYGLAEMDVSPYLGILIGAIVEATSCITNSLLISTKLGRKGSFIIMMCLTIICILCIPIIVKYSSLATVFIAQLGKYAISGAASISWIFVPELFPTFIRSTASGFFIAVSRIGAIVAPIIDASVNKDYLPYTFYASSALAVIVVLFSLTLPETKDKPLDDIPEYARNTTDI